MNSSLLLQLIAARAGGNRNSAFAEMLSRVRSVNGGSPIQDPKQLLAQLGNNNPLVEALSKHFAEVQAGGALPHTGIPVADPVIDVEPEPEAAKQIGEGNGKCCQAEVISVELKEQVQSLQSEIKILRDRCDLLASTVGACCLCWGQDSNCRACRGRGKPGYAIPDEALFGEYVLPAMRVLRAQKIQHNRPTVAAVSQNGAEPSAQISGSN
jgi:hypothetical protein